MLLIAEIYFHLKNRCDNYAEYGRISITLKFQTIETVKCSARIMGKTQSRMLNAECRMPESVFKCGKAENYCEAKVLFKYLLL